MHFFKKNVCMSFCGEIMESTSFSVSLPQICALWRSIEDNSKPHKVVYFWLKSIVIALKVHLKLIKMRRG